MNQEGNGRKNETSVNCSLGGEVRERRMIEAANSAPLRRFIRSVCPCGLGEELMWHDCTWLQTQTQTSILTFIHAELRTAKRTTLVVVRLNSAAQEQLWIGLPLCVCCRRLNGEEVLGGQDRQASLCRCANAWDSRRHLEPTINSPYLDTLESLHVVLPQAKSNTWDYTPFFKTPPAICFILVLATEKFIKQALLGDQGVSVKWIDLHLTILLIAYTHLHLNLLPATGLAQQQRTHTCRFGRSPRSHVSAQLNSSPGSSSSKSNIDNAFTRISSTQPSTLCPSVQRGGAHFVIKRYFAVYELEWTWSEPGFQTKFEKSFSLGFKNASQTICPADTASYQQLLYRLYAYNPYPIMPAELLKPFPYLR
ncbi:unnamed protein product [Ceratitis capitata]|uniref:(Mediterranean fruit fly) hypothetical protein n=1 Tax=Ceratitis capitata TaxID=7213 RepID=A0A811V2V6_CERCA|nr:unnamed protein product [Ceratitis capitata]